MKNGMRCSHVRRMPMSALLASADRLPVVVRIPAGPLGSLKCDPPKGNGRRPQKKGCPCLRWASKTTGAPSKAPLQAHAWCHVKGIQAHPQIQAQIIHRAPRVLKFGPITPAHRKPPWTGYKHTSSHNCLHCTPLTGICRPPNTMMDANRSAEQKLE